MLPRGGVVVAPFHRERHDVVRVQAGVGLVEGEAPDARGVGIGRDVALGDSPGDPHRTLAARAGAQHLHQPHLLGVCDGEGLAGGTVAVLCHQGGHHPDGLAGGAGALQRQLHEVPVVEQAVGVLQLLPAGGGGLRDGELVLVHQPHHGVGVGHLWDDSTHFARPVLDLQVRPGLVVRRPPAPEVGVEAAVAGVGDHHRAVRRRALRDQDVGAGRSRLGAGHQQRHAACCEQDDQAMGPHEPSRLDGGW